MELLYVIYIRFHFHIFVSLTHILNSNHIPQTKSYFHYTTYCTHLHDRFHNTIVRLENEHIGNTDQYRVTREVPLPYNFNEAGENDDDSDYEGNGEANSSSRFSVRPKNWRHRSVRLAPLESGSDEEQHLRSRIPPREREPASSEA